MQRHRLTPYLAVLASLALAPALARAQAFGLNEIGSCAFARGFSATSAPCNDASVIFWNPGAAAGLKGNGKTGAFGGVNSIYAGVAAISIAAKFERDSARGSHDADVPIQIVPHVFLNHNRGRYALGFGVYVPYGLTSQWEDDFPGRFLAKKASIQTIYFQPNIAWATKSGKWMIGGGPVIGWSKVELIQGADLADQVARVDSATNPAVRNVIRFSQLGIARRTEFARATLKGSSTEFGFNVGGLGKISKDWTIGVRYLSSLYFDYGSSDATFEQRNSGVVFAANNPLGFPAGTQFDTLAATRARFCTAAGDPLPGNGAAGTCAAPGLLGSQLVNTKIAHPDQFQIGFAYRGFPNWMIAVDYDWTGWRKFRELPVDFARDTLSPCPTARSLPPNAPDATCDFETLDKTGNFSTSGTPAFTANQSPLFEDYNNTSSIRIGAERAFQNGWLLRLGFAGVAASAPDETVTPLLPEQDRTYWTIGTEIPLMKDRASLDAAYGFVWGGGRRGRIDERASRSVLAPALNSGVYRLHANVLSISVKSNF